MLKNKSIGIIGGGQLAQMFIQECNRFGIKINVLDESDCPANNLANTFIEGDVRNSNDIRHLSKFSDTLTFELENINCDILFELESEGKDIIPRPHVLKMIQDKTFQKQFFNENSINTIQYKIMDSISELREALSEWGNPDRVVIKLDRGGYDGKGVFIIKNGILPKELKNHKGKLLLEKYQNDIRELSVISFVDRFGNFGFYEPVEMVFDPELNLIDYLITPTSLDELTLKKIKDLSHKVVTNLNSPGLFAIEMFLIDGEVFVNEISPRPHNSGHPSIEVAKTSQYEQLMRILMGWPCGSTQLTGFSAMMNIIGPSDFEGDYSVNYDDLLNHDDVYLHLYGKSKSKPGRKMGHITITSDKYESVMDKLHSVRTTKIITIPK